MVLETSVLYRDNIVLNGCSWTELKMNENRKIPDIRFIILERMCIISVYFIGREFYKLVSWLVLSPYMDGAFDSIQYCLDIKTIFLRLSIITICLILHDGEVRRCEEDSLSQFKLTFNHVSRSYIEAVLYKVNTPTTACTCSWKIIPSVTHFI